MNKHKHLGNELPKCHFVHQKSPMDWPGTEPMIMQWKARVMFELCAVMHAGLPAECLLHLSGFDWKWNALQTDRQTDSHCS